MSEQNNELRIISESEGYLALGLYGEAWDVTEAAPVEMLVSPKVMTVRATCAMALQRYDEAEAFAMVLGKGTPQYVEFAAHVLHQLAVHFNGAGDAGEARRLIGKALQVRPEERAAILADPKLRGLI